MALVQVNPKDKKPKQSKLDSALKFLDLGANLTGLGLKAGGVGGFGKNKDEG